MSAVNLAVLDYGSGNVHSVCRALEEVGARVRLTSDSEVLSNADGLVVPGVGAFSTVMQKLEASNAPRLIDLRLAAGRPVFGICVGLQVMFETGTEHGITTAGLGQWPGTVEKLQAERLPHIGWSRLTADPDSRLFVGIQEDYFYFVHSYAAQQWLLQVDPPFIRPAVSWANYGQPFIAAVENGPLVATQFHPEKSGSAGLKLLSNWVATL